MYFLSPLPPSLKLCICVNQPYHFIAQCVLKHFSYVLNKIGLNLSKFFKQAQCSEEENPSQFSHCTQTIHLPFVWNPMKERINQRRPGSDGNRETRVSLRKTMQRDPLAGCQATSVQAVWMTPSSNDQFASKDECISISYCMQAEPRHRNRTIIIIRIEFTQCYIVRKGRW